MAGDTLRDAFRTRLAAHVATASITLPIKDLVNTGEDPDASAGFIALEFLGGGEDQYTFGAPGNNLWRERGQVTVRVYAPLGRTRDTAEAAAEALRNLFRADRFAAGSRTVRILDTAPMGGGQDEGGLWAESVALGYQTYNTA
jgi:hypothetical protein